MLFKSTWDQQLIFNWGMQKEVYFGRELMVKSNINQTIW